MMDHQTHLAKALDKAMDNLQAALDVIEILHQEDPVFGANRIKMASARLKPEALKLMQTIVQENSHRL